jgi:hypothetical protein
MDPDDIGNEAGDVAPFVRGEKVSAAGFSNISRVQRADHGPRWLSHVDKCRVAALCGDQND